MASASPGPCAVADFAVQWPHGSVGCTNYTANRRRVCSFEHGTGGTNAGEVKVRGIARIAQGARSHGEIRALTRRAGGRGRRLPRQLREVRQPGHPRVPQVVLDRLHRCRVARRGQRLLRHPRQGVHRLPGRLRHLHAGPPAPHRCEGRDGPAPAPGPSLAGAARPDARLRQRAARHGHSGGAAVLLLLQLRHRGQRGRAQTGQAVRQAQEGQPQQRCDQLPGRLPRQVAGKPERDRKGRLARALLPTGSQRALCPVR